MGGTGHDIYGQVDICSLASEDSDRLMSGRWIEKHKRTVSTGYLEGKMGDGWKQSPECLAKSKCSINFSN